MSPSLRCNHHDSGGRATVTNPAEAVSLDPPADVLLGLKHLAITTFFSSSSGCFSWGFRSRSSQTRIDPLCDPMCVIFICYPATSGPKGHGSSSAAAEMTMALLFQNIHPLPQPVRVGPVSGGDTRYSLQQRRAEGRREPKCEGELLGVA